MLSRFIRILLILWLSHASAISIAQSCSSITLASITNSGPYTYATMNQNDGIRNGPDYGNATIYYPTNASGSLASVAIVPGFVSVQSSVAEWGPFLASHGIVTIIIDTNGLFDFPPARAAALVDALETVREENSRTASPLLGQLDISRQAVMGWSMGGGGAQLAASLDPSIKAVVALCPWLSVPSSSDLDHSVPTLILSGENDPVAAPAVHADIHYALTPSTTDKMLFEVESGNHSIANDPANAQGDIGRYGLAWLRYFLEDDQCYCPLTVEPSAATSQRLTNVTCPPVVACPPQLTVVQVPITDGVYQAGVSIISSGAVPMSGMVTMKAGGSICLDPGFNVAMGADFAALIESCL